MTWAQLSLFSAPAAAPAAAAPAAALAPAAAPPAPSAPSAPAAPPKLKKPRTLALAAPAPVAPPITTARTVRGIAADLETAARRYCAVAKALHSAGHHEAAQESWDLGTYWRLRSLELREAEAWASVLPAPDVESIRQATVRLAAAFESRAPGRWITAWCAGTSAALDIAAQVMP